MIIRRNYELILCEENKKTLDYVADESRKHFNLLLGDCIKDYNTNNNKNEFLKGKGRNLRDYSCLIKHSQNLSCRYFYSSLVKNISFRVVESYKNFFKHGRGYPKFKHYTSKFFSLLYDEPSKGPKYLGSSTIKIPLGEDLNGNRLDFKCKIKGFITGENVKQMRIVKKSNGKYYLNVCVETNSKPKTSYLNSKGWIAIDPNHKNLFAAIDSSGDTFEIDQLQISKTFDNEIDILKSKRDRKKKGSEQWKYYNVQIQKRYSKRDGQLKTALYTIAHSIVKRYNVVMIGDYTPDNNVAKHKNMKRSMLNQTHIGTFRAILEHVCEKYGKTYIKVDEKYTTSACCIHGNITKRPPSVREWTVDGRKVLRDINSSVNIAAKMNYKLNLDNVDLGSIKYQITYSFREGLITRKVNTNFISDSNKIVWHGPPYRDSKGDRIGIPVEMQVDTSYHRAIQQVKTPPVVSCLSENLNGNTVLLSKTNLGCTDSGYNSRKTNQ